MTQMLS